MTEMAKSAPPPEAPAREAYGWHLVLDLYGCRLDRMTGRDDLAAFVRELCDDVLGMKRFGEPIIEHFGHANPKTDGYSLVQLIESSSVVAHFSEERRSAYVDIFSCVQFDPDAAAAFTAAYFGAERSRPQFFVRD